jgi:hypothetical protein
MEAHTLLRRLPAWGAGDLPTYFAASHEQESPSTPYAIPEFQGGSFDPWGGNVSQYLFAL